MDGSMERMIFIGVAVGAAAIVGSYAFTSINSQKESAQSAMNSITEMTASMSESEITSMAGKTVMGSEVNQIITKNENADSFYVEVKTKAGDDTVYICDSSTLEPLSVSDEATLRTKANTPSENAYINPTARFKVDASTGIVRNSNDVIVGIVFEQVD